MSECRGREGAVGRAAIVVRGEEILTLAADGHADAATSRPVTATTRFQISSVSKQWLATIFGLLHERGLVDWDDRIDRWLPTLPYGTEITVHQLLTHTSGLGHWDAVGGLDAFAVMTDDERIDLLERIPLRSRPGAAWFYSGLGYTLLGQIAALAAEQPYPAIIHREIIVQLGLTETTCGRPTIPNANVALGDRGRDSNPLLQLATVPGTGDIWSTVYDLVEYVMAFQDGRVVRTPTARTLLESNVDIGADAYTTEWVAASRYAYGRYLGTLAGHKAWFHSGDNPGFQSFLAHLPDCRTTVAVLSNADDVPIANLVQETLCEAGVIT